MVTSSERSRLRPVDGLRGIAAMLIVFSHVYAATGYPYIALNWVATTLDFLYSGIPLFFVLSGFCLYYPLTKPGARRDWRRFFYRRAHRLLPPYYIAIAAVILLPFVIEPIASAVGLVVTAPGLPSWTQIWTHLTLTHTLSTDATYFFGLDGPFWTLPIEWQLYLAFPLAVWIMARWQWRGVAAICAATIGYRMLFNATDLTTVRWPIDMVDLFPSRWLPFALGMLVAQRLRQDQERTIGARQELADLAGAGCLFLLAAYFMYGPMRAWPYSPRDVLYGGFYAVLLYLACLHGSLCGRVLSMRVLVWLGMVSYSLYLIHGPIIFALSPSILALRLDPIVTMLLVGVICIPIALAAAAGFFYLAERPFLNAPRADRNWLAARVFRRGGADTPVGRDVEGLGRRTIPHPAP